MNAGPRGNERPMGRTPLTPVHCEIMDEVCRCNPDGWHSQPSAFEPAEELRERGLLKRRMVDGTGAIYHALEAFQQAAAVNAARAPMIDPGSQN